jgi:hypothetical protein
MKAAWKTDADVLQFIREGCFKDTLQAFRFLQNALVDCQTKNPWNTTEPPKDGSTIVAVGRVIFSDEFSTTCESFVASVRWIKDQSNYEGWHFAKDGITVAQTLEDEVKIDWWLPYPGEAA